MKAKVIASFLDKDTKKLITSGTEIDFNEKRVEALAKRGFVIKVENKAANKSKGKKPGGGA
jgi:hypothetical protein